MGIFILVPIFSLGDAETQNSILKISECTEVLKYAVKIVQNTAGMRIVMVSSVCGIAYKNVTITRKGIQDEIVKRDTNCQSDLKTHYRLI